MQTQCPTRKNLKRHQNRLERDFPSFQFTVTTGEQIEPRHMREIIAVNRLRMAEKGKVARFDETRVDWIIDLARQRGMMTLVRIDGRICAGAGTLRLGYTLVSHVNAHDPLYNDYRMGCSAVS